MRVFLDTNVLVAAFTTRGLCSDVLEVALFDHELAVSRLVIDELRRVLVEKMREPVERVSRACALLEPYVTPLSSSRHPGSLRVRDPADLPIVHAALAAEADVLVSGDRDLLDAELPIEVLTPRAFWERLRSIATPPEEVNEGPPVAE